MLKLTAHRPAPDQLTIRVEGRLDADGGAELRVAAAAALSPAQLTLDLSGLMSVDEAGCELLTALRRDGCRLRGASLYINEITEEV